jgi:hypothetical protein
MLHHPNDEKLFDFCETLEDHSEIAPMRFSDEMPAEIALTLHRYSKELKT